jgi:hypothetical protein
MTAFCEEKHPEHLPQKKMTGVLDISGVYREESKGLYKNEETRDNKDFGARL